MRARRPTSGGRGERGVTLIEVMIASAVFTVGVLGLLPLFYRSMEGTVTAAKLTQATALAASKLDELQRRRYDDIAVADWQNDGAKNLQADGTAAEGDFGADDGTFYRQWKVESRDFNASLPGDDYKVISVRVRWYDGGTKAVRETGLVGGKAVLE